MVPDYPMLSIACGNIFANNSVTLKETDCCFQTHAYLIAQSKFVRQGSKRRLNIVSVLFFATAPPLLSTIQEAGARHQSPPPNGMRFRVPRVTFVPSFAHRNCVSPRFWNKAVTEKPCQQEYSSPRITFYSHASGPRTQLRVSTSKPSLSPNFCI
jgi:hypothetical protein